MSLPKQISMEPTTRMPTKAKMESSVDRYSGALSQDGRRRVFSSGNHPVEMLLPVLHLDAAGFEVDIATISGDLVKFEMWAFPNMTRQ